MTATTNLPDTTGSTDLTDIAAWGPIFDDGFDTFVETFGMTMPRLRSDFGKNGKGWIDDLTGEALRELNIIILACPPTRAWWELSIDQGGGGTPDCASRVNFTKGMPDDGVPNRQSDTCGACRHSQWTPTGDGHDEPPACGESANVLAFDVDEQRMFWLRFGRTAIKPFRNYLSALKSRRKPMFSVVTNVTLADEKRDKLEWLIPVFGIGQQLTPAEVVPLREVAEKAMQSFSTQAEQMDANERSVAADGVIDVETVAAKFADGEEPF